MLGPEETKRIEREIECLGGRRDAAALEALKIVQEGRGWVSGSDVKAIASYLGIAEAEVEGVATFYNMIFRSQVGRHVILVCDSISCWVVGGEDLIAYLKTRLGVEMGGTTRDGRYTLLPGACLGVCEQAPAMMIGERLYTRLDREGIDRALDEHR